MNKNSRQKLSSEKYKGMFPNMEDKLDEWTQELREADCFVSGFTLKVKALQILRELAQYSGTFSATDGWLRGFLRRKNFTLRRITTTGRDLPSDFLETIDQRGECGGTSDEEEQLDKNGKRVECGGTSDEEENDEEVDKRVAKKLKTILNTLDLTPKTLLSKKKSIVFSSRVKSFGCQNLREIFSRLRGQTMW